MKSILSFYPSCQDHVRAVLEKLLLFHGRIRQKTRPFKLLARIRQSSAVHGATPAVITCAEAGGCPLAIAFRTCESLHMEDAASVISLSLPVRREGPVVTFSRPELRAILDVYGRMVASGEWRDYAMSFDRHVACFAAFCRTSDSPLFRIEKRASHARRNGAYAVIASDGRIYRSGREVESVLRAFEPRKRKPVTAKILPFARRGQRCS